ncbi:hypothetical protein BBP40_007443 [Aspergillus hancockii]|nr:hypothetical protein BBP40_007443 [Aspergillus hancockii]
MTSPSSNGQAEEDDTAKYTSSNSPGQDEYELFSAVMACIRWDNLAKYASATRKSIQHSNREEESQVKELGPPIFGSYHVLFPVTFNDGVTWLFKVPANGTHGRFHDSDARALRSEALTMHVLYRETTIPLPKVYAYSDTCDNELSCPFILFNHVKGVSLYKVWYDRTSPKEIVQARRTRSLRDLASAMTQLEKFSFNNGGSLVFDDQGLVAGIGPLRLVNIAAMRQRLKADDSNTSTIYLESRAISNAREYYTALLDCRREPGSSFEKGVLKLLRMLIGWIPQPSDGREPFVLAHPDLNMQNILVSEDGTLQAVIDWDGVSAVPRSIGNERYPSWLTRDWDPGRYHWTEDMERGQVTWEDSPDMLKLCRSVFAGFIGSHQSEGTSIGTNLTTNSLICENLLIAANDPSHTVQILDKVFNAIVKIVKKDIMFSLNKSRDGGNSQQDEMGDPSKELRDFDFYNVSCALKEGRLSEYHRSLLKFGFNALLQQSWRL